ncbi:MAG: glycosyltransferase family 2 protein [Bacteroidia bacterium]|nr:glycosyltransferase family 2 protein [Bacteroidia bacterium]
MVPISVVIITFNEEKNIERCILSVKHVAEEILVLDSFSKDATAEICSKHGVRFIQREWEGYSASKNFANQQAVHDWVLSLDADEALSEDLQKALRELKKQNQLHTMSFNRLTNYCGTWIKHSGWYPDKKIRLFNRSVAQWQGALHEDLKLPPDEKVKHLNLDILHYSYYTLDDHLKQIDKYTNIAAKDLYNRGKRPAAYKMILNAWAKFVSHYLIHLGFLDGAAGLKIAWYSAYATYLKYKKARGMYAYD